MPPASKAEIVAAAAAKWVRILIEEYKGAPEGLRGHLLRELTRRDKRANEIMASIIDDLL